MLDVRDCLRDILHERNINCASLARSAGMTSQQLYDCFAHRRRLEASELLRICHRLRLTLDDFSACVKEATP